MPKDRGDENVGKEDRVRIKPELLDKVYSSIRKLALKPHRFAASYASLQRKAAELYREGRSPKWIAQHFNEQGFITASGKPWTHFRLYSVLHNVGAKAESFETLHRKAITGARARGLNHQQMAVEFNERQIPRRSAVGLGQQPMSNIDATSFIRDVSESGKNRPARRYRIQSSEDQRERNTPLRLPTIRCLTKN